MLAAEYVRTVESIPVLGWKLIGLSYIRVLGGSNVRPLRFFLIYNFVLQKFVPIVDCILRKAFLNALRIKMLL